MAFDRCVLTSEIVPVLLKYRCLFHNTPHVKNPACRRAHGAKKLPYFMDTIRQNCEYKAREMFFKTLLLAEHILAYAAGRTDIIIRKIFKPCSRNYSVISIAFSFIINPIASITNILFHKLFSFQIF